MTPLHVGTLYSGYTHPIGFYSKRNGSATHQIAWAVRGLNPLQTTINEETPHFKLPLVLNI